MRIAIYAHIHCAYVRMFEIFPRRIVANTGSVSLSYEGDRRAAYLDDGESIRRVAYELDKELKALASSTLRHTEWLAKTLQMARPQMPAAMPSN
jgi:hypothetical protein